MENAVGVLNGKRQTLSFMEYGQRQDLGRAYTMAVGEMTLRQWPRYPCPVHGFSAEHRQ